VFSADELSDFRKMFLETIDDDAIGYMFKLANKNPRDLWHLMDRILHAQYTSDPQATRISGASVKAGFDNFVSAFNFYEYYPRKSNSKASSMDIFAYIKHLVKLSGDTFTRNQLNMAAGTGSSTQNYCVAMENIGLIENTGSASGSIVYRIRDPKVVHAIENNMDISKSSG
jgi:hypothetical protein